MAKIKIGDLSAVTALTADDVFPVEQNEHLYKVPLSKIDEYIDASSDAAVAAEVARAKAAEQANATAISTETARAKKAESAMDESISAISFYSDNFFSSSSPNAKAWYINASTRAIATNGTTNRCIVVAIGGYTNYIVKSGIASIKRVGICSTAPKAGTVFDEDKYVTNGTASSEDIRISASDTDAYMVIQLCTDSDTQTDITAYYSSLEVDGVTALDEDARKDIADLQEESSIHTAELLLNTYELSPHFNLPNAYVKNGVTYNANSDGSISVSSDGAAITTASFYNLIESTDSIPDYFQLGHTYRFEFSGSNVGFRVIYYIGSTSTNLVSLYTNGTFTVPKTATGIVIRLYVNSGKTVDETVSVKVYNDAMQEVNITGLAYTSATHHGITYSWSNGVCTVSGTAETQSQNNMIYDDDAMPPEIVPGETYYFTAQYSCDNICFDVITWDSSNNMRTVLVNFGKAIHIPADSVGFAMRLRVANTLVIPEGSTVSDIHVYKTVRYQMPKKLITIIDDDTVRTSAVIKYHDNCQHMGVRGSYAVETQRIESGSTDLDTLLQYEDEGFAMLIHCYYQNGYTDWNEGEYRNVDNCRANLAKGLRQMRANGFANYNYWIAPAGIKDRDAERLAREMGVKCLVSTSNADFNYAGPASRYFIKRVSLNYTDESFTNAKARIDAFVNDDSDGWIIICTHFNEWENNLTWDSTLDDNGHPIGFSRFNEFIEYAQNKGLEFVGFPEGFSFYEPYCID